MSINTAVAERVPFTTSRMLEYFTTKELQSQIGFPPWQWQVALLKELIDNALDACEAGGVPPIVRVTVDEDCFAVEDGGPGIPPEVVRATLDYSTRTSSNAKYVSPTRGQLGNALKCVIAAPFVVCPGHGLGVTIEARGIRHRIVVRHDALAQEPVIGHAEVPVAVQNGTMVRVDWSQSSSCPPLTEIDDLYRPRELAQAYATFNPHASVSFQGEPMLSPVVVGRWVACEPTSAHWYTKPQFRDLIAAYVQRERQGLTEPRSLREFVMGFDGLKRTAKAKEVLESADMTGGLRLADLVDGNDVSMRLVGELLNAMTIVAKPVKPERLGTIGKENWVRAASAFHDVRPDGLQKYARRFGESSDGRPFVVEAFLAQLAHDDSRVLRVGINWSPALTVPIQGLDDLLHDLMVEDEDNVFVGLHVVLPYAGFTDRGKSRVSLPGDVLRAIDEALGQVAKPWTDVKKKQRREERKIEKKDDERLAVQKRRQLSLKEAAWRVLVEAHRHATGGKTGAPVKARQLMYAVRKLALPLTGGKFWKDDRNFTSKVLPDFIERHQELTRGWNVVYDARGELTEPHSMRRVSLGTLEVRNYVMLWSSEKPTPETEPGCSDAGAPPGPLPRMREVPTLGSLVKCENKNTGPHDRYRFVLMVEKEGFNVLLNHARILERFDVALATTKGLSTTAARELVRQLSLRGVTTLVLHDFDLDGLKILHTLRNDTQRFKWEVKPLVVDVGLRLADAEAMGLDGEEVSRNFKSDPREYLARMGATDEEQQFLFSARQGNRWTGKRIELNELTNDQFLAHVEQKLTEAGAVKVVPSRETLNSAYVKSSRDARREHAMRLAVAQAMHNFTDVNEEVPDTLVEEVTKRIAGTSKSWNQVVGEIVAERLRGPEDNGT